MAKQKDTNYFTLLAEMAACAGKAATKLQDILSNFSAEKLSTHMVELHEIESTGDELKHVLAERLIQEFITPIDREDILGIASEIDDVIDSVEDVLLKIYMFNLQSIREEAHAFADLTKQCCEELLNMMNEFHNYKKSSTLKGHFIELNRLEEVADDLYMSAVRKLYVEGGDAIAIAAWTEVFNRFEKCCDNCEHVANQVENVRMKNM